MTKREATYAGRRFGDAGDATEVGTNRREAWWDGARLTHGSCFLLGLGYSDDECRNCRYSSLRLKGDMGAVVGCCGLEE